MDQNQNNNDNQSGQNIPINHSTTSAPEPIVASEATEDTPVVAGADSQGSVTIPTKPAEEDDFFSETPLARNANKNRGVFIHDNDPRENDFKNNRIDIQPYNTHDQNGFGTDATSGSDPVKAVTMTTAVMGLVLLLGLGTGFFAYRYGGQVLKNNTVSADPISFSTTSPSVIPSISVNPSTSPSPDKTLGWQDYTSSKYNFTLKYPKDWSGSTDTKIDIISLTSAKSTVSQDNAQKVEITFKNANGKLLKPWIVDNNTANKVTAPEISAIKIDGKEAYQEVTSNPTKSIVSYVFQASQVMIITYTAPAADFDSGKINYQTILDSIKLQ